MLRVALLVPEGFATLSFAPLAAFEAANMVLGESFYDVHVTSVTGGRVANSFGNPNYFSSGLLDSNIDPAKPLLSPAEVEAEMAWLKEQLARPRSGWLICCAHQARSQVAMT